MGTLNLPSLLRLTRHEDKITNPFGSCTSLSKTSKELVSYLWSQITDQNIHNSSSPIPSVKRWHPEGTLPHQYLGYQPVTDVLRHRSISVDYVVERTVDKMFCMDLRYGSRTRWVKRLLKFYLKRCTGKDEFDRSNQRQQTVFEITIL